MKFFEEKELETGEVERRKKEREAITKEMVREGKRRQREGRWKNITESKYNRWYECIKGKEVLGYFEKGWGERKWRRQGLD